MSSLTEAFRLTTPVIEIFLRVTGKRESGAHSLTDLLVVVLVAQAAASGMAMESGGILDSLLLVATVLGWSVARAYLEMNGMISVIRADRNDSDAPRKSPTVG